MNLALNNVFSQYNKKYGTDLSEELTNVAFSIRQVIQLNNNFSNIFDGYKQWLKDTDLKNLSRSDRPVGWYNNTFKKTKGIVNTLTIDQIINNPDLYSAFEEYVNLHVPFDMKTIAEKYIENTKKSLEEHGYYFDEPNEIFEYAVIDNLILEVLDKSKNTLTVKGLLNPYASSDIVIPSFTLFKGKYCRIVRIGTNAFYNITSLNSVKISDGISSIGAHTFSYCSSLKKVEFPASLTEIEGELFYDCNNLESIFVDFDSPKFLSVNRVLYTKDHKKIVAYPNAKGKDYKIIEGTE